MAIGERTEHVVVQTKGRTLDGSGPGQSVGWVTLAALPDGAWAKVKSLSAGERIQAQAMGSAIAYELEIPYSAAVLPTQRVIWDGRTLQIVGVRPARSQGLMYLDCREGK